MSNAVKKYGMTKDQIAETGMFTGDYHRLLFKQHIDCMKNGATTKVLFDGKKKKYYVLCSNCKIYKKRSSKK